METNRIWQKTRVQMTACTFGAESAMEGRCPSTGDCSINGDKTIRYLSEKKQDKSRSSTHKQKNKNAGEKYRVFLLCLCLSEGT